MKFQLKVQQYQADAAESVVIRSSTKGDNARWIRCFICSKRVKRYLGRCKKVILQR